MTERHITSSEEPTVQIGDATLLTVNKFLWLFTTVVAVLASLVFTASIYMNSFGYFGDTGYFHVYNDRQAKADFLKQIDQQQLPKAYILGSSDMLPFQPQQIEQLFGAKTFNLGNFWGRAEEMWGWVNFLIHDLKAPPEMLIVGIEPWTFSVDSSGPPLLNEYRRRFIVAEDIFKYAPKYSLWRKELSRFLDQISAQNMKIMFKTIINPASKRKLRKPLPANSDGTNAVYNKIHPDPFFPREVNEFYDGIYQQKFSNQDDVEKTRSQLLAKEYIRYQEVLLRLPKDQMDENDIQLFEKTVRLCEENNIKIGIILLPVHPYFRDMLAQRTRYLTHIETLKDRMNELKDQYGNISVVFDASDINSFAGDPSEFHDSNHMSPVNAGRIMDIVYQKWESQ